MERDLWLALRLNLGPAGVLERIENGIAAGTPDVAYSFRLGNHRGSGWIENKDEAWPKLSETHLHLTELKLEQVMFAERWENAGGRCWMLTRWSDLTHTLCRSPLTRALYERRLTRTALLRTAPLHWRGPWPVGRIVRALCS